MKAELIGGLIIGMFLIASVFATIFISINEERTYDTSMSCNKLKECISLEIRCLGRHVENKLFMFKWESDDRASLSQQKKYYIKECMNKDKLK